MRETSKKPYLFKRRDLLKGAMILPGALVSASFAATQQKRTKVSQAHQPDRSQIRRENERPGTRDFSGTDAEYFRQHQSCATVHPQHLPHGVLWRNRRAAHDNHWSHGSRPHGPDEHVQQITHNLLRIQHP